MFRKVHDAPAALRGLDHAPRLVVQRRAMGLLLEHGGPAHDDGERVVQLVGHACEQAAHEDELFPLAQLVGERAQPADACVCLLQSKHVAGIDGGKDGVRHRRDDVVEMDVGFFVAGAVAHVFLPVRLDERRERISAYRA
jgi:hypothetical protein